MNSDQQTQNDAEAMAVDDRPAPVDAAVKRKGRGFKASAPEEGENQMEIDKPGQTYDRLDDSKQKEVTADNAARSIEGWVLIVRGVHEEATEEDLLDKFSDYGSVMNLAMPLDRRTGYVKGYALVEYETRKQAEQAIKQGTGSTLLEQVLECDFAFVRAPSGAAGNPPGQTKARRSGRSQSPPTKPLVKRIE